MLIAMLIASHLLIHLSQKLAVVCGQGRHLHIFTAHLSEVMTAAS